MIHSDSFYYDVIFQELKNQLGDLKDTNETTAMDLIHADNVKQGRDKYKTLKVYPEPIYNPLNACYYSL